MAPHLLRLLAALVLAVAGAVVAVPAQAVQSTQAQPAQPSQAQPVRTPGPPPGAPGDVAKPLNREQQPRLTMKRRPRIEGVARWTRTLRARPGQWRPRPAKVRYRWFRDGRPIPGAAKQRYRLRPEDVGHRIQVRVRVKAPGHRWTRKKSTGVRGKHRVGVRRVVTYHVETRGRIQASVRAFARQAQETFDDPRGWRNGGVRFRRVARGGDFSLVLSEASWVPRFHPICSSTWSCRVGRYVVINQTRWQHASPAWNAAGRSRRDYRHMVVNHETGHWLGRGHRSCPGPGQLAPVMMQQSKGTGGCRFNPWPRPDEL